MQLALYREERPEVFQDIIGQKHIVRILQNQIRTGTVSQAYLFAGTHGTGKTSMARILAKAVNCLDTDSQSESEDNLKIPCGHCENCESIREGRFVDVVELDAASNNKVEDLRAIIDMVKYPPSLGRYKVYIIDEVHMLSISAENAFLKTLEEPPPHAIFILATTDPQKVKNTIRSRCMQLNFRRVSEEDLITGMERICLKKNINATKEGLMTIAMKSDGSVRDALTILEQCMATGVMNLDRNLVLEYTGSAGDDFYIALTDAVTEGELGKALLYIDEMIQRGKDAYNLLKDWLEHYRNLLILKYVSKPEKIIGASRENITRLQRQAKNLDSKLIEKSIRFISEYINAGRYSDRPRILLETAAVRLAQSDEVLTESEITTKKKFKKAESLKREEANLSKEKNESAVTDENIPELEIKTLVPDEPFSETAEEMWEKIAEEVASEDPGFATLVGKNSQGKEYFDGELKVAVSPIKLPLISKEHREEITKVARFLYGENTFVTLQEGEVKKRGKARHTKEMQETEQVIDEDITVKNLKDEINNIFPGVDINITDN